MSPNPYFTLGAKEIKLLIFLTVWESQVHSFDYDSTVFEKDVLYSLFSLFVIILHPSCSHAKQY